MKRAHDDGEAHASLKRCKLGSQKCAQCFWEKHAEQLQKDHAINSADGPSWLQAWKSPDGLRLGCVACYLYVQKCEEEDRSLPRMAESGYACFAPISMSMLKNVKRHAQCPTHQQAIAFMRGEEVELPPAAPADKEWQSVWSFLRKNRHMDMPSSEHIGRFKVRKIVYCLAEALRARTRKHLKQATSMTLSLDGAKTRLLVRYASVTKDLAIARGVLGMGRSSATGHAAVLKLLSVIMQNAATDLAHAPPEAGQTSCKSEPTFDEKLYEHIRSSVVVWNSDAAGDEMLAAQESQRLAMSPSTAQSLLPNLTFVNRDRTHASRRVAHRPWLSAPELMHLFEIFCTWFKTIQYSPLLQGWYTQFQQEQEDSQCIKVQRCLAHAAHRFDSTARPFGLCTLTFPSVVLTAVKAWTERRNDPQGKAAYPFLEYLTGAAGASRMVLAGMLADALDEALLLTRALDHEATDTSLLHSELQRFLKNTATLFLGKQCVEMGFTKHMIQQAKNQWIWIDGSPKTIGVHGGLRADALANNLKLMSAWTGLAAKVISTEFPSFDLMCSFRLFALPGLKESDSRQRQCLERAEDHAEDCPTQQNPPINLVVRTRLLCGSRAWTVAGHQAIEQGAPAGC